MLEYMVEVAPKAGRQHCEVELKTVLPPLYCVEKTFPLPELHYKAVSTKCVSHRAK